MRSLCSILLRLVLFVVALLAVALAAAYVASSKQLSRTFHVDVRPVAPATDLAAIAAGHHLAMIRGCAACHGTDFGGGVVMDNVPMGKVYGPNLTTGRGGLGGLLTNADWTRAIRHGIAHDGHPLVIMPSKDFTELSDRDVAAIVGYIKSLPPVDRQVPAIAMGPVARVLLAVGKFRLSADLIDHAPAAAPAVIPAGITPEYGRYLATTCTGCHNSHFSGGKIAEGPPDWPPAANLTRGNGTRIAGWTEADFIRTLRTMKAPDGTPVNPVMPAVFGQMDDTELKALWSYLQTLPPRGIGE